MKRTLAAYAMTLGITALALAACAVAPSSIQPAKVPATVSAPTAVTEALATTPTLRATREAWPTVTPTATSAADASSMTVTPSGGAVAGGTVAWSGRSYFPIGVLEDANIVNGDLKRFEAMISDLGARGLDSVMFTNNFVHRDAPLLNISDKLGFNVFMLPSGDFNQSWWPNAASSLLREADWANTRRRLDITVARAISALPLSRRGRSGLWQLALATARALGRAQ